MTSSTDPSVHSALHPQTRMGHVHLRVANLDRALAFYHGVLGFDITQRLGDSAAFLSAGGYHHHVAYNLWRGERVPPYSPDTLGLRNWTLETAAAGALDAVRARLEAIGASIEERDDGSLLARDSSAIAVLVK